MTNGVIINNSQTTYEADGASAIGVNWSNVNGNGKVKVTVSNSASCSSCSGGSTEITLPIRYLGNPGNIKINGVPYTGSHTLPCGTTSFTASVDPATNATNYTWELPSGWGQSGSGTSITVTPTPSGGGVLKVKASRSDVSSLEKSSQLNIIRFTPTFSVTGDGFICDGQTKTFTLSGSQPGDQISWSTNLSGSSSSTALQVSSGSTSGASYVTANVTTTTGCGTFTRTKPIWVGQPSYFDIAGSEVICANQLYQYNVSANNPLDQATYVWSSSSSNLSLAGNGFSVNASSWSAGTYLIDVTAQNACGTVSNSLGIDVSYCFARYTVYPNPAKDQISIRFEDFTEASALPDEIILLSGNTTKPIRTIAVQEAFGRNAMENGNMLKIDARDLPRGVYYLHIKNNRRQDKNLDIIRILLE